MVVDRDRERLLGRLLSDHVLVEGRLDLVRGGDPGDRLRDDLALLILREDLIAERDALVADVDRGARDELPDRVLGLAAEGTAEVAVVGHGLGKLRRYLVAVKVGAVSSRFTTTWSIIP